MHKYPQNQSYVGSRGQTLTTNVSMTPWNWQICHQTRVLSGCTAFVPNQIRYQINTVPTPAAACTRAWLTQKGGWVTLFIPGSAAVTEWGLGKWGGGVRSRLSECASWYFRVSGLVRLLRRRASSAHPNSRGQVLPPGESGPTVPLLTSAAAAPWRPMRRGIRA